MSRCRGSMTCAIASLILSACAGQPREYVMQEPVAPPPAGGAAQQPVAPAPPRTITFPNGTVFGDASARQASSLAQIVVEANNNNMKDYEQLRGMESQTQALGSKNLQTSQQALSMLERLSQQQGTGEITLFFPTGSAALPPSSLQYDRLVRFVDYLSRDSRGRKVIFVLIGSASATGSLAINEKLSRERAAAPEPIIDQYLVNVSHQFFKVYGLGDVLSPKHATLEVDQRYQNVRIIAVYETDQIPRLPG